jgi:tetratricopeptide (TPR) repeat protein
MRGAAELRAGNAAKAKDGLSAALMYANELNYATTARWLARAHLKLDKYAMALDCLELANSREPDSADTHLLHIMVSWGNDMQCCVVLATAACSVLGPLLSGQSDCVVAMQVHLHGGEHEQALHASHAMLGCANFDLSHLKVPS